MWSHWEKSSSDYGAARVCVAVSDSVTGPYTFYKTFRPNRKRIARPNVVREQRWKSLPYMLYGYELQYKHCPPAR